jgi:hypothetical protein
MIIIYNNPNVMADIDDNNDDSNVWQAVLVQPIGDKGVLIAASGTVRGFSKIDQVCLYPFLTPF